MKRSTRDSGDQVEADQVPPEESERILAYYEGGTNTDLLRHVSPFWWRSGDLVLDPTHGLGIWCRAFPSDRLICHDLDPNKGDGVDYRFPVDKPLSADLILFDPDYVTIGGHETSTMPEKHNRSGMRSIGWEACFADIAAGLKAQAPLLKPTGRLLTKSGAYTENGAKHNGLQVVLNAASEAGLEFLGWCFHYTGPAPQPHHERQLTIHEVGNMLCCFGAPKARRYLERTTPRRAP